MTARKNEDGIYVVRDSFEVGSFNFEGTATEIKYAIDIVVEDARKRGMIGDGYFDISYQRDYYDSLDVIVRYNFDRAETDKEKTRREAAEAKMKEAASKKRKIAAEKRKLKSDVEYAEFLRLKEKFKEFEV